MKNLLTSTVIASGLLAFVPVSSAATFDFQGWIGTYGEQGFNNSLPFSLTDAGLTLTATASETTGASHVYMDGEFNNIIGGMGVCTTLTVGMQCTPSSDDNVSIDGTSGEVLSWSFDQNITELTLEMGNADHYNFANNNFQYNIGGSGWQTAATNGSAMITLALTGGANQIDFRAAGNTFPDQFYIRNADVTVVPVPAALWLFGSGLIGVVGLARRKTS